MFPVENLKIELGVIDITPIVNRVNISESIHGDLTGSLSIEDGVNLIDTIISTTTYITISYTYMTQNVEMVFYCDGITNVAIESKRKRYQMHLRSVNDLTKSNTIINESFSDTLSTLLIKKVYETMGIDNLVLNTPSVTHGKYIAPNIPSSDVIETVLNNAYDDNESGFFLFQRLRDNGITTLDSVSKVIKNKIKNVIIEEKAVIQKDMNSLGTSNNFLVVEDNDSIINKIKLGMFGLILNQLDLSETKSTTTKINNDINPYQMMVHSRNDMYDNKSKPLLSFDKSHSKAISQKARLFNKNLKITDVVSLPFIGVGDVIEIKHAESNISSRIRYGGDWIVSDIEHKYDMDDGLMIYKQDYNLVRE